MGDWGFWVFRKFNPKSRPGYLAAIFENTTTSASIPQATPLFLASRVCALVRSMLGPATTLEGAQMRFLIVPLLLTLPLFGQSTTQKKPKQPATKQAIKDMSFSVLLAEAKRGDSDAQFQLGSEFEFGIEVYKDEVEAAKWYLKAAKQGHAKAQQSVGTFYQKGKGVPQDYAEAVKWYRKAAEQEDSYAQLSLGYSYDRGQGVPQDYAEAVKWYRKAAMNSDICASNAQLGLAKKYHFGEGVPQNFAEAYVWYNLSVAFGDSWMAIMVSPLRDDLASKLSPQALEQAQERAKKLHEEIQARMGRR